MENFIKRAAITILSLINVYPTKLTRKNELRLLLNKLRPISCSKKLIRLGPNGDGGYLVPNDLHEIEACFSPGVDIIAGFEKDCAQMGMNVFLADKSIDTLPESHERFQFTKKHLGVITNDDFMTLDDWVSSSVPESFNDLLLQMDIEGFEYEVFLGVSDKLLSRFRIIIAEFHNLDKLLNEPYFNLASRVFDKILQTHSCVHIHPNNCRWPIKFKGMIIPPVMEITFLRNDRIESSSFASVFPHLLDYDNSDKPPFPLPKCWYS